MESGSFTDTLIRHRSIVAIGVVIFTVIAFDGVRSLDFDDNPRAIFRSEDEDFRLMEEVFDQFGTDENNFILIVQSDDLFNRNSLLDLKHLSKEVGQLERIESVISLTDERLLVWDPLPRALIPDVNSVTEKEPYRRAKRDAIKHPLIAGQLVSEDGNHALLMARMSGDALTISEILPVHEQLIKIANRFSQHSSLEVHVTGLPSIRVDSIELVQQEAKRFTVVCALAALAMAIVIFRCWQMVIVVCIASMTGTLWTVGTLGLVGEEMTVLTVVLPMLVMVIAFTDSVHLIVDVRHSRAKGFTPQLAARDALKHLTVACGLTSFTTAIGFASLGVSQTEIIRRFGLACGMGAVLTFLSVITIVPLLSSTRLGNGMLPSRRGQKFDLLVGDLGSKCVEFVLRQRWIITSSAVLLTLFMGITVTFLKPDHRIVENLSDHSDSTRTLNLVDRQFGGILPSFVVVDWPENVSNSSPELRVALEDVHKLCVESPATNYPFSILNFMQVVPGDNPILLLGELQHRLVRLDLRRTVVICRSRDLGTAFYSQAYADLENRLHQLEEKHKGFRFRLTGTSVVASHNLGQMISDLARSLGLASIAIFVTLTIVFRSIRIGLICLIPNALPLLLTASLLVWTGEYLRFSGVIVLCVCLGIAVDDTIHVINRFQREMREVNDVQEALRRTMKRVGSALLITTMILIVGFSITLTSEIPGNRMFGLLSCIAIAAAFVGDLVVLPAMLACFSKRLVISPKSDLNIED